jgi:hypothetical protein
MRVQKYDTAFKGKSALVGTENHITNKWPCGTLAKWRKYLKPSGKSDEINTYKENYYVVYKMKAKFG